MPSGRFALRPSPSRSRSRRSVVTVMPASPAGTGPSRTARDDRLGGGQDPAVAGAAAQVAGDRLADLEVRRCRRCGRAGRAPSRSARGAEAALHRALVDERLLHVGEVAVAVRQPLDGGDSRSAAWRRAPGRSTPACRRAAPSTSRTRPARTRSSRRAARGARAARRGGSRRPRRPRRRVRSPLTRRRNVAVSLTLKALRGRGGRRRRRRGAGRRRWSGGRRSGGRAAASSPKRANAVASATRARPRRRRPSRPAPATNASASRARTGTGPTEPSPRRTVRPSRSTTRAAIATAMTMALRVPTFRYSCGPRSTGSRTAVISSPGASAVRFAPVTNSRPGPAGRRRSAELDDGVERGEHRQRVAGR